MAKIVVVGANHAGAACVNTILDNYTKNEVVVFDYDKNLSFWKDSSSPCFDMENQDGNFGCFEKDCKGNIVRVYVQTIVERIDYCAKIVYAVDKNGNKHEESFDKIVLATGSTPDIPKILGGELQNIEKIKSFQNAKGIINKLKNNPHIENIVIIGGGYIGVELAEALQLQDKEVCIIERDENILLKHYDKHFSKIMQNRIEKVGISLKLSCEVLQFEGKNGKVCAVVTNNETIPAEMVVWAVGVKPNNTLGKDDLKIFHNGAFIVDEKQQTSKDGVFAIGDCATVFDNALNEMNYIALASNAVHAGIIAAHNAVGIQRESIGVQGSNAISALGLHMMSTGLTLSKAKKRGIDAESAEVSMFKQAIFERYNNCVDLRVVFDKNSRRIIGAQIVSEHDVSMLIHMFSLAIQENMSVDKLEMLDTFFLPHFNQPYNYITKASINAVN